MKREETRKMAPFEEFEETKSLKKARKAEEANQKRLESLKNSRNLAKSREKAVSETLKRIDSGAKPKVIKFTSDDEGESTKTVPKSTFSSISDTKNKLFSSESESSDDESGPNKAKIDKNLDEFAILPQYEGKAGQKLLALQSKFAGDQRFKMNAQFLDDFKEPSEEGSNENTAQKSPENEGPTEIQQEHDQQMHILEKILGKSLEKPPNNSTSGHLEPNFDNMNDFSVGKKSITRPMVRFDPKNPTHFRYKKQEIDKNDSSFSSSNEILATKIDKKNLRLVEELLENLSKEEDSRKKQELIENCGRNLYEVDSDFLQRLKQISTINDSEKNEEPKKFSLLAALGRNKSEETGQKEDLHQPDEQKSAKPQLKDWQIDIIDPRLRRDSSSSDEDQKIDPKKTVINKKDKKPKSQIATPRQLFFFYLDENLMKDSDKFFSPANPEVMKKQWEKQRPFLIDTYKKRRKQLLRNLKKVESANKTNKRKKFINNKNFDQSNFKTSKNWKSKDRGQSQKPKKRLKLDLTTA